MDWRTNRAPSERPGRQVHNEVLVRSGPRPGHVLGLVVVPPSLTNGWLVATLETLAEAWAWADDEEVVPPIQPTKMGQSDLAIDEAVQISEFEDVD